MSHIVTAPGGTRYRTVCYIPPGETVIVDAILNETTGVVRPMGRDPFTDTATEAYTNEDFDDGVLLALERLPRVPGWPKHCPAPQFIASVGDDVLPNPGDTLAWVDDVSPTERTTWSICENIGGWDTIRNTLKHARRPSYLIARADPTEDA